MKIKKLTLKSWFFFCFPLLVCAFEWPVADKRVATTFGQNVSGGFNTGIELLGRDETVYPIADGEVIFACDENSSYTSLPRGAGSFMILYHEGDIHSVYSHLKRGSLQIPESGRLARGEPLGVSGNTGASTGGSLFLQIIDVEENLLLNPLKQLSPEPEDNAKPVIESVVLVRDNLGRELVDNSVILPGQIALHIGTRDRQQNRSQSFHMYTPYKITLSRDGVEVFNLVFDALRVVEQHFVLNSTGQSYSEIYTPDGLIDLGELNLVQGITHFRFLVTDYGAGEGNSISKDLVVTVTGE